MLLDVSLLLTQPIGSIRRYRVEETLDDMDREGLAVQVEMELLRTDRGILMTGVLDTSVKAICSRCLSDFEQPLNIRIEEEFVLAPSLTTDASCRAEEDGIFVIDESHEIDLAEVVRQFVTLALPMKPLCREECAGLCASCGHNLNLGPCQCPPDIDPRLAELARLFMVKKG